MIILGVDPGTTRVGYGVIKKEGSSLTHLSSGLLAIPPAANAPERLLFLQISFKKLLTEIRPTCAGVEKLFFLKNKKTALSVAQARGVLIVALAYAHIPFVELAPSEVKLAVTGDGRATKEGVAKMVSYFLKLPQEKRIDDITDALAIAIAASQSVHQALGVDKSATSS